MLSTEDSGAFMRVLLLEDFNTRIVVIGTMLLGAAAGLIGTFLLLRKRALVGDVLSHTMLPGIVISFLIFAGLETAKSQTTLLLGAACTAAAGVLVMMFLKRMTRLAEDAVMALVLGSFFGLGIMALGVVLDSPHGNQAGLESYIYGKTASMTRSDVTTIAVGGLIVVLVVVAMFKEFRLLCFDEAFGASLGHRIRVFDGVLMCLVILTTLVGIQAVGLILIIALLVIPPAASRFWTNDLFASSLVAMVIGALGCWIGVWLSASSPRLPAGALVVLAQSSLFVVSLIFGSQHGLLQRVWKSIYLRRKVDRDHLLRSLYELTDRDGNENSWTIDSICELRSWKPNAVEKLLRRHLKRGEITQVSKGRWRLSTNGMAEAAAIVRNHRLWEQYLIRYAHLAASHVDRSADRIEHVLGLEMVNRLEEKLYTGPGSSISSPHPIGTSQEGEVK